MVRPLFKVIANAGIIPGIKVDIGAKDMAGHPGEKITEGLDGLRDRLKNISKWRPFAKWRAVIAVGDCLPAGVALKPTRRRWLVMPRCARKLDWSQSSSRKCSWMAGIPWSGALR